MQANELVYSSPLLNKILTFLQFAKKKNCLMRQNRVSEQFDWACQNIVIYVYEIFNLE